MKVEITAAVEDIKGTTGITDMGDAEYTLKMKVQITPGDYARLMNLQRQRVPMKITLSSDQALMDIVFASYGVKEKVQAKDEAEALVGEAKKVLSGKAG